MVQDRATPPPSLETCSKSVWSWYDSVAALGWFVVALLARAPLIARAEGMLDHDQSVVGLMAMDIAAGRRLPIFFDGQRYMGAIEGYVAAAFVRLFGHMPQVIDLAPLLAFGLFVACQYAVWSRWRDRTTGHMAAVLTVTGAPMMVLWGIIPRGGYVEFLTWALPTLAIYLVIARQGRPTPSASIQAIWAFWLAIGHFVNPLSLTVYATLALDWTFGRHGQDLRSERGLNRSWLDRPLAPFGVIALVLAWLSAVAGFCHVDLAGAADNGSTYAAFNGLFKSNAAIALGALGVMVLLLAAAWWSKGPFRIYELMSRCPWALVGVLMAWAPTAAYAILVRFRVYPTAPSLPMWISAPWKIGVNIRDGLWALGPLIGSDPHAIETVLIGAGIEPPGVRWPILAGGLESLSPLVVTVALVLIAVAALKVWRFWPGLLTLRGNDVASPIALAATYLAVSTGMYLLQGASPNSSSIRYLMPVWVVVPGLISCGLRAIPRGKAVVAATMLMAPWLGAQLEIWGQIERDAPARSIAVELAHRGVTAIVAQPSVAIVVANLTHGQVGGIEYQALWDRLGDRYRDRFQDGQPVTCVVDRLFPWAIHGQGAWDKRFNLGRHVRALARQNPGRVKPWFQVDHFDVYEIDLPLSVILALEPEEELASTAQPAR